jgi:HK97 family phage portal protein
MEERSRFQKALDIFRPSRRQEEKIQSNFNQIYGNDVSIFGYNTSSGFVESNKLKEIGDGSGNSAVVACLNVLSTSFAEPPLQIVKNDQIYGDREVQQNHPLATLYHRPNPFMSSSLLSHYIIMSLNTLGDAFLYKNRNKQGQVVELVPLMPHMVEVRGNEETLITHYEYYAYGKGEFVKIPFEDMVHIRQGISPNDHRRGHAPLKTVLREILGDEAAGQFTFSLLDNMAVPGVVLTPRSDGYGGPTREEAESISQMYKEKFGGSNRGAPMVLSGAMNVEVVSFSPEQMRLAALRRIPEERVSAVLGVPAILAGLGAGLDAATFNNTKELKEFFTEQKLIPLWRTVAAELTHQLLIPDFGDKNLKCDYDINSVRALQPDVDNLHKRVNMGVAGGWITIGEARKVVGLDVDKTHDVYLRPLNMIQVDTDGNAILNDMPEANRRQAQAEQGANPALAAASSSEEVEKKDLLTLEEYPQVNLRAPKIQQNEEPRNEEKYIAKMPNGAFCVISHDTGKVIKCFETEKEAEAFLGKKDAAPVMADTYTTREEAIARAKELGCDGYHVVDRGPAGKFYMPCDSEEDYGKLVKSAHPDRNTSSNMWMYDTIEAAERRAKEIGCEGYHEHEVRGTTYYMPCSSHESLERTKKSYIDGIVEELKVSYEEAEVLMESQFSIEPENVKEKPKKDRTNFPSPGDDRAVSISNSKYKQFPYGYAKDLKENWPEIWRRGGNGGNPPTSFTGNDAFRNWTKYQSGDRSESVLNWVRRRERYMGRHQGNTRLAGTVANIKWGGVSNIGVSGMKKVINDQKKVVRARRKAAEEMADEIYAEKLSETKAVSSRVRKALVQKVKDHNAKNPKYRANLRTLTSVFNRGVGAYRTNPGSVRGNVTGADQWGLARVNGFLHALRTGRFKRKPYDQDLLPSNHPLSSKKSGEIEEKASSVSVGQSVSWSINKDPDPPSTVHGIVTSVNSEKKEATMQVYAIMEDGSHKKTDRKVTMPISKLKVIKPIK